MDRRGFFKLFGLGVVAAAVAPILPEEKVDRVIHYRFKYRDWDKVMPSIFAPELKISDEHFKWIEYLQEAQRRQLGI